MHGLSRESAVAYPSPWAIRTQICDSSHGQSRLGVPHIRVPGAYGLSGGSTAPMTGLAEALQGACDACSATAASATRRPVGVGAVSGGDGGREGGREGRRGARGATGGGCTGRHLTRRWRLMNRGVGKETGKATVCVCLDDLPPRCCICRVGRCAAAAAVCVGVQGTRPLPLPPSLPLSLSPSLPLSLSPSLSRRRVCWCAGYEDYD